MALILLFLSLITTIAVWFMARKTPSLQPLLFIFIFVTCVCAGFASAKIRTIHIDAPYIGKEIKITRVTGKIIDVEPAKSGSKIIVAPIEIEKISSNALPEMVRLTVRKGYENLAPNQVITVLAGLNPPSPPVSPGAFDFQRHSYFQQLGAIGFTYGAPEILEQSSSKNSITKLRYSIASKALDAGSMPTEPILLALMTGQRGSISDKVWENLRVSGLAHMLAISGLHVGMVAGVLFFFSRLLMAGFPSFALNYPIKKYAALIALVGAFFYMIIVGATIPTQRAVIMTGLFMVAICLDRSPFSLRLVAIAACAILLYRPESLLSVSFQMSFAAVTALVAFFERTRPYWMRLYSGAGIVRKITTYFLGLSCTTIIAGTVTGFFGLYHFQQFALYGLIANLVGVPILAFIVMPNIVFSYFLIPFGLEFIPMNIAEWGISWIMATASYVANINHSALYIPVFPFWIFIVGVFFLWLMVAYKGIQIKVIASASLILLILILLTKQPDIIISSEKGFISLLGNDRRMSVSDKRKASYTSDNLMRRNGQLAFEKKTWKKEGLTNELDLICDKSACRQTKKNQNISILLHERAIHSECDWADIIVSHLPVPYKCSAKHVVDLWNIKEEGAHSIWLQKNKTPMVVSVKDKRGERPWTHYP